MNSRRRFMGATLGGSCLPAWAAAPSTLSGQPAQPEARVLCVVDAARATSLRFARAEGPSALRRNLPAQLTPAWAGALLQESRTLALPVAGRTSVADYFILRALAADHGHAVVEESFDALRAEVRWRLGPRHAS